MQDNGHILRQARLLTGPWVLYDGTCRICRGGAARFGPMLRRRGFRLATLQSPVGRQFATDGRDEMKVVTRDGRLLGGAEGVAHICKCIWWARPVAIAWRFRFCRTLMRRLYRWIADRRHCTPAGCPTHAKHQ